VIADGLDRDMVVAIIDENGAHDASDTWYWDTLTDARVEAVNGCMANVVSQKNKHTVAVKFPNELPLWEVKKDCLSLIEGEAAAAGGGGGGGDAAGLGAEGSASTNPKALLKQRVEIYGTARDDLNGQIGYANTYDEKEKR
jgi:hypothetical protein